LVPLEKGHHNFVSPLFIFLTAVQNFVQKSHVKCDRSEDNPFDVNLKDEDQIKNSNIPRL